VHGEKGPSTQPFGICHAWCAAHRRRESSVDDGQETSVVAFASPEEYVAYRELTQFTQTVPLMRAESCSGQEAPTPSLSRKVCFWEAP
jgi:hypothetical protein